MERATTRSGGAVVPARVWVADGKGQDLRRIGLVTAGAELAGRAGSIVELTVTSWDWIARLITGHGPDVIVLAPPELRDTVTERLRAAADSRQVSQP